MKSFKQFVEPEQLIDESSSSRFINDKEYLTQLQEDLRKSNPFASKVEVVGEFIMCNGKFLDT